MPLIASRSLCCIRGLLTLHHVADLAHLLLLISTFLRLALRYHTLLVHVVLSMLSKEP